MTSLVLSFVLLATTVPGAGAGVRPPKVFVNPVLPGFWSDPSVCKGPDGKFCLAVSSLQFFPGIPLFESEDLVHWKLKGHAVMDPDAVLIGGECDIGGFFAPTLRWNGGKFYITVDNHTPVGGKYVDEEHMIGPMIMSAPKLEGPWAKPQPIPNLGGDPSLDFIDGRCYYSATTDGGRMMQIAEFDPERRVLLTEPKKVWAGTGGIYVEGTHVFRRGDWYYVMIAEGGTEYGHKETIARSKSIYGPYEASPYGPVAGHAVQKAQGSRLQAVGHGDFVYDADGNCYLICHAIRPQFGMHHLCGRETICTPVEWTADGWPRANGGEPIPDRPFNVTNLPEWDWVWLRNPRLSDYSIDEATRSVALKPSAVRLDEFGVTSFVGVRQTAIEQAFTARLREMPAEGVEAGVTAYMTRRTHYDLAVVRRGGKAFARVRYTIGTMNFSSPETEVSSFPAELRIVASARNYGLFLNGRLVAEGDPRHISSEADCSYNGIVFGVFAEGPDPAQTVRFADLGLETPITP